MHVFVHKHPFASNLFDQGGGEGECGGRARARVFVVLSPSWPESFLPQHLRSALFVTYAHVWWDPSASSPTAPPTSIVVGVVRSVVVPSPSWP